MQDSQKVGIFAFYGDVNTFYGGLNTFAKARNTFAKGIKNKAQRKRINNIAKVSKLWQCTM